MAFIEPMHRNKPNITYLLTWSIVCGWILYFENDFHIFQCPMSSRTCNMLRNSTSGFITLRLFSLAYFLIRVIITSWNVRNFNSWHPWGTQDQHFYSIHPGIVHKPRNTRDHAFWHLHPNEQLQWMKFTRASEAGLFSPMIGISPLYYSETFPTLWQWCCRQFAGITSWNSAPQGTDLFLPIESLLHLEKSRHELR